MEKKSQQQKIYMDEQMDACQRDCTGSFYTPYEMARWMVWKALDALLGKLGDSTPHLNWLKSAIPSNFRESELVVEMPPNPELIWRFLTTQKVADIASGTGVFLIAWLDILDEFGTRWMRQDLLSEASIKAGFREAVLGVFAADINAEALQTLNQIVLERYRLIWDGTEAVKVFCGNALTDAFKEMPWIESVMASGGFDLILGNPPYIGEKGNRAVFDELKTSQIYKDFYTAKMDYYYFFIHRAHELLSEKGIMAYLISNYFITADGATTLRREMRTRMRFVAMADFADYSLFKSAKGHHSMAIFITPNTSEPGESEAHEVEILKVSAAKGLKEIELYKGLYGGVCGHLEVYQKLQERLYLDNGYMSLLGEKEDGAYQRLVRRCQWTLDELCHVNQGIVSGLDHSRADGSGVFVVDQEIGQRLKLDDTLLKPFYKNSDIDAYWTSPVTDKRILYIEGTEKNFEERYPEIIGHLKPHREVLMKRRECQTGRRPWYALQWPRNGHVFEGSKIVVPHRSSRNRFGLSEGAFYGSADIYFIAVKNEHQEVGKSLLLYLLALLNSRVYNFLLIKSGKKKGRVLELYATPLKKLPVYLPSKEEIYKIAEMTEKALKMRMKGEIENFNRVVGSIEAVICDLYGITLEDRDVIEHVVQVWRQEVPR